MQILDVVQNFRSHRKARFVLLAGRKFQILEKNGGKLPWRIDVEIAPGKQIYFLSKAVKLACVLLVKIGKHGFINGKARALHIEKHFYKRQFDIIIKVFESVFGHFFQKPLPFKQNGGRGFVFGIVFTLQKRRKVGRGFSSAYEIICQHDVLGPVGQKVAA